MIERSGAKGRGSTAALVPSIIVSIFVAVLILWVLLAMRERIRSTFDDGPVQSYNGTTWIGDVCHVDDVGVLWCTARG